MSENTPQYINSVIRAIHVLELYEKLNVQALGIAEISRGLCLQKSTTFNIVKTLLHLGWLVQETPNGKYMLGTGVLKVSAMAIENLITEDLILQEMHRIRDLYNEDVLLTAMIDGTPVCVEKVQSSNILRIHSRVGRIGNLIKGSAGKALFAWQPKDFILTTLDKLLQGLDPKNLKDEKIEIIKQLDDIRQQGYCISISEQNEGVASISAPIINPSTGYALYSLSIIGEDRRIAQKDMNKIQQEICNTAKWLSENLRSSV